VTTAPGPPAPSQDAHDRPVPERPYVGLVPFDEVDAAYFFGRERESALILANLTASRLTLLYAPSGVGKSSVLRAGVLPQLHHIDDDSYDDLGVPGAAAAYISTWRDAPLERIAKVIVDAVSQVTGAGALEEAVSAPKLSVAWLREVLRQSRVSTLYLILDQFEEYFFYHATDRGEEGLTAELGRILSERDLPVHVLLSIREDALASLDRFKGRVPHLFDNYLRLAHLSRNAAQAAIEGPLDRYNHVVPPDRTMTAEPGLIATLLDQVRTGHVNVAPEETEPGFASNGAASDGRGDIETPYLQLVLTRLWDQERATGSSSLRQSTLESLGGAQTIVQTHLDKVMAGLSPTQVDVAAAVFRHLVTTSGAKIALSAEDLAEWLRLPVSGIRDLLETLCSGPHRILRPLPPSVGVAGPPRYEIFHDVMGSAVLDWRRRYLTQQQQAESSRRLVAEREKAQAAARTARQRLRRTQLIAMSMAIMLLTVSVLAVLAYLRNRDAKQEGFLAQSAATFDDNPVQSLKYAVNAYELKADAPARSAVLIAASSPRSHVVAGPRPAMIGMILTPDSQHVVAYSANGSIRVIGDNGAEEHQTGAIVGLRGTIPPGSSTWAAAVNPDASRVVLGTDQGEVVVINATTKKQVDIKTEGDATPAVNWIGSATNGLVLVASSKVVTTYNPETGKRVARIPGLSDDSLPLADGHIVTSGQDRKLRVWDPRTAMKIAESSTLPGTPQLLRRYGQSVVGVIPNFADSLIVVWNWQTGPDPARHPFAYYNDVSQVYVDEQTQSISIAADKGLTRYSLDDGSEQGQLPEQADWINDMATSPDGGRWITTAGSDGRVMVWFAEFRHLPSLPTYEFFTGNGPVNYVGYLRDGTVVSLDSDGTLRRWEPPPVELFDQHKNWVNDIDLSHDGSLLATASSDHQAFIIDPHHMSKTVATVSTNVSLLGVRFDPTDPHRVFTLGENAAAPELWRWDVSGNPEHVQTYKNLPSPPYLMRFAISPNGKIVAGVDSHGTVDLWDAQTGALRADHYFLGAPWVPNSAVAFDPSSRLIAATSPDGVRIWRLGTAERPMLLPHPNVTGVVFDPSGQRLASTAQDGTVKIWTRDGKLDRTLIAHDDLSSNPSFSNDGDLLAVGTAEGLVEVWDIHSPSTVTVMLDRHHSDSVNGVVFLPGDRSRLISASADTTVALFKCPACSDPDRVIRNAVNTDKD
jgi:WD40 repeat protein